MRSFKLCVSKELEGVVGFVGFYSLERAGKISALWRGRFVVGRPEKPDNKTRQWAGCDTRKGRGNRMDVLQDFNAFCALLAWSWLALVKRGERK